MTEIHAGGSSVRSGHKENIPIDGTEGGVVVKSKKSKSKGKSKNLKRL